MYATPECGTPVNVRNTMQCMQHQSVEHHGMYVSPEHATPECGTPCNARNTSVWNTMQCTHHRARNTSVWNTMQCTQHQSEEHHALYAPQKCGTPGNAPNNMKSTQYRSVEHQAMYATPGAGFRTLLTNCVALSWFCNWAMNFVMV